MVDFEAVTFGGSGLDRAAHLRADDARLVQLAASEQSDTILFWRGKPLLRGDEQKQLVRLAAGHRLIADVTAKPIFLGQEGDRYCFAQDISSWAPDEQDLPTDSFMDHSAQLHPDAEAGDVFLELRNIMTQISARDAELAATARSLTAWHGSHKFCANCGAESFVRMGGWQRTCDTCGRHHFPRTDPVVIMLITHGNKVLLGRGVGWPDDMYSLLAGFVEPGETPEAAVRREVFEEAGVKVGAVQYLGTQPWPYPSSLMIGCRGEATSTALDIDPEEIADALWMTREEVATAFAGSHPKVRPARNGSIAHFILRNWLADSLE